MKTCSSPFLDDVSSEAKPCPKQTERLLPSCAQKPPGTLCRLTVAGTLDAIVVVARQRHDHRVHKLSADGENTFQSFLHGAVFIRPTGDHSTENETLYSHRNSRENISKGYLQASKSSPTHLKITSTARVHDKSSMRDGELCCRPPQSTCPTGQGSAATPTALAGGNTAQIEPTCRSSRCSLSARSFTAISHDLLNTPRRDALTQPLKCRVGLHRHVIEKSTMELAARDRDQKSDSSGWQCASGARDWQLLLAEALRNVTQGVRCRSVRNPSRPRPLRKSREVPFASNTKTNHAVPAPVSRRTRQ